MAIETNIGFFRGEDVTLATHITKIDSVTGLVVDDPVTGWGLSFSIAKGYGQTVAFTKAVGTGITITGGPTGEFEVAIADTDTDTLTTGNYVWDVKRTDGGQEAVLAYGRLSLKPNVAA